MTDATQRLLTTLDWMILTFQYQRKADDPHAGEADYEDGFGLDHNWSPELREAMSLRDDLRDGRLIVSERKD